MKGLKKLRNDNKKGNAALVALLVVIIIIGIGASVMILAGRNTIDETGRYAVDSNSAATTQPTTATTAQTEPEKPKVIDLYAKQSANFKQTNIQGFAAQASVLIDLDTDEMLAGNNMDQRIYPASLTKIMTILVACENINSYDDTYTFKDTDFVDLLAQDASLAGFQPGDTVTARDMLYGAVMPSGADACIGLANLVAGSEEAFVKLMNDRAKALGLKNTNFVNSWGMHDPNHYSSVNDVAVMMKVANHNVTCQAVLNTFEYTTSPTASCPDGIQLYCVLGSRIQGFYIDKNGNGIDDDTAKVTGGKTGYTNEAGSCLATLCSDSETGHTYVCVVIRSTSTEQSIIDSLSMYEKYLPGSKAEIPDAVTSAATGEDGGAQFASAQATATTKTA